MNVTYFIKQLALVMLLTAITTASAVTYLTYTSEPKELTTLERVTEYLFLPETPPEIACTPRDENIGIFTPSYRLRIACEANSWGRFEVYHVWNAGEELAFRESQLYNDSIGITFMTNPVELYVRFFDENGATADVWLKIDSKLRSCIPKNLCSIP